MTGDSPDNSNSMQPPPNLRQLAPRAVVWALAAALLFAMLYGAWGMAMYVFQRDEVITTIVLRNWLWSVLRAYLVTFCIFFVFRWVFLHRKAANQAFTAIGFLATIFGLAMLVVFFFSLGYSAWQWFHYTPRFIELQNQKLRAEIAAASDSAQFVKKRMKDVYRQRTREIQRAARRDRREDFPVIVTGTVGILSAPNGQAALLATSALYPERMTRTEGIRKKFDDKIVPYKIKLFRQKAEDIVKLKSRDIRLDTTPPALLWHFITSGPSGLPQNTGVLYALVGSFLVALITMIFAVPVGVGAALYLEEYRVQAKQGWIGNLIQVNINNLAGVPSVVYGILGIAIFVDFIFRPLHEVNASIDARNTLGAGLTLGLLTLPIIIVTAQEAIRAVPQSLRSGGYALGATQWQVIWRNVLPVASPGIFTGTILAISRAIGEAAPLVLFGALLFVDQQPGLFTRFSVMPMQIFAWADRPNLAIDGEPIEIWQYNAAMASVLLLIVLLGLNAAAIVMRNRAQRAMRD